MLRHSENYTQTKAMSELKYSKLTRQKNIDISARTLPIHTHVAQFEKLPRHFPTYHGHYTVLHETAFCAYLSWQQVHISANTAPALQAYTTCFQNFWRSRREFKTIRVCFSPKMVYYLRIFIHSSRLEPVSHTKDDVGNLKLALQKRSSAHS